MNEMEWHKMDYLIFSAMRKRKRHLLGTNRRIFADVIVYIFAH